MHTKAAETAAESLMPVLLGVGSSGAAVAAGQPSCEVSAVSML